MSIHTPRLELRPAAIDTLEAELRGPAELAAALAAEVPPSWPPDLYDRAAAEWTLAALRSCAPADRGWWQRYFIRRPAAGAPATLIGCGGYKGPPDGRGAVEIGYAILPEHRRLGYASEAVGGLLARGFASPRVARVAAETLPDLFPSIGVLEKAGFRALGEGPEPGVVRFEIARADYLAARPPGV